MALGDISLLILRVVVGIIFIYHGFPKIKNPSMMEQVLGNKVFPTLLGIFEILSGLFLILGLFINYASVVLGIVMLGAIYYKIVKWKVPFFAMDKTGWEFDFVLLASNIILYLSGPGIYTISYLF